MNETRGRKSLQDAEESTKGKFFWFAGTIVIKVNCNTSSRQRNANEIALGSLPLMQALKADVHGALW